MDGGTDPAEREAVLRAVRGKFGLSPDEAQALIDLAEEEARGATDYYQFTSIINRRFTQAQKVRVVRLLWDVAWADAVASPYEEHLIRKLSDLLYVEHRDYINAKLEARAAAGADAAAPPVAAAFVTTTRRVSASATARPPPRTGRSFAARCPGRSRDRVPPRRTSSTLLRFVLLSMALHTLVILVFGTASTGGGGGRRGEGAAGPLEVTLRALGVEPERRLPGRSRHGRALRTKRCGRRPIGGHRHHRRLRRARRTTRAAPSPPRRPAGGPAIAPPVTAPAPATPPADAAPVIDVKAAESADRPLAPVAPLERVTAPSVQRDLAPPVELKAPERPTIPATPLERVTAPSVQRDLAPPVELKAPERPTIPATPLERVTAPSVQRDLAPPVELKAPERPTIPATPLERVTAPSIPRDLAPPVELEGTRARGRPRRGAIADPSRRAPAGARPRPRGPARRPAASGAAPDPTAARPPAGEPRLRFGTPDPGDELFQPRTDVMKPSAEPGGTPRLDLDAARRRAREITSEGSGKRGLVPVVPPPAERRNKLAEDIEKAAKPDCRNAYQGMGLLAAIPLIAGAITDSPCRW